MCQMLFSQWVNFKHMYYENIKNMFCGVPPSDLSRNMDINHADMSLRCRSDCPHSRRKYRVPTLSLFPGKLLTFDDGSLGPGKVLSLSSFLKSPGEVLTFLSSAGWWINAWCQIVEQASWASSLYQNSCFANFPPQIYRCSIKCNVMSEKLKSKKLSHMWYAFYISALWNSPWKSL